MENKTFGFSRKIGTTLYRANIHYTPQSTESFEEKLMRLIRHDALDIFGNYDEYSNIRWRGAKERFVTAHADELEQYKKAQRLLHKFGLSHPIDRKALRAEKAKVEQEIEALRPDVDAVQAELDELKTVRYWVRKVIPDALPNRTESGNPSLRETMEAAQNQSELNNLMEKNAKHIMTHQQNAEHHESQHQHNATL